MKASAILKYKVEDVFKIFIRAAKRDFKDFNEENPVGCKIVKTIYSGAKPIECTVEITEYEKNRKYVIKTMHSISTCTSSYLFYEQKDGSTSIQFEEDQGSDGFFSSMTLWLQRIMAKRQFKLRFNNLIESLENELKTYTENVKKSTKNIEENC
ncbi:MAG: DUF3284 domain-containing protein [Clostridium butyricum]|nr:DUF3284 domain-containing protein [Clostridium butyricum]